jgi:hypothetical protein
VAERILLFSDFADAALRVLIFLASQEINHRPASACQRLGFCVHKGRGFITRQMHNRFKQHFTAACPTQKSKLRPLSQFSKQALDGFVVLQLRCIDASEVIADSDDEHGGASLSLLEPVRWQRWFHIARVIGKPWDLGLFEVEEADHEVPHAHIALKAMLNGGSPEIALLFELMHSVDQEARYQFRFHFLTESQAPLLNICAQQLAVRAASGMEDVIFWMGLANEKLPRRTVSKSKRRKVGEDGCESVSGGDSNSTSDQSSRSVYNPRRQLETGEDCNIK